MRFVKTGAIALALACSPIIGAGAAHADQTITVTEELLDCALRSHVGLDVLADVDLGDTVTVSDQVYIQLEAAGCPL